MGLARFPSVTRALAVAAGVLAIAVTVGVVLLPQAQGTVAGASTTPPLGVYAGAASPSVVNALGQSIGQQPAYAMDFLDGTSWQSIENPSWFLSQWQGSGYSMIWGVPILPNDTSYSLAAGASGAYNQYFVTLAQAFVAGGQGSSIIRLGWEFNGGWFPWAANGQAANFIAYWQQIVDSMRSVPGANFKFEWNPTLGDQGVGNLANYYPGNDYVDYIGADVYDVAWASYPGADAEFTQMETETYGLNWLSSFAAQQGKPITLPEWGLGWGDGDAGQPVSDPGNETSGGDDPTFINDMANWIATNNVFEATFWDYGSSTVGGGSNPNSEAALVSDFGQATTTTTTTPPPPPPPPAPTTSLAVSAPSANYGSEWPTTFTVTVSPSWSGNATVLSGTTTLCTAVVQDGTGSCTLSNNELWVGTYSVFAQVPALPTTAPVSFVVVPRLTATTLTVSPSTVSVGAENSMVISVQVAAITGGVPFGTVSVSANSVTLCTITLSNAEGTCRPARNALPAGSYTLTASYGGDPWDATSTASAAATARARTLRSHNYAFRISSPTISRMRLLNASGA
jgi:hypothetical protein